MLVFVTDDNLELLAADFVWFGPVFIVFLENLSVVDDAFELINDDLVDEDLFADQIFCLVLRVVAVA